MNSTHSPDTIVNFWFNEITPKQWWVPSNELDEQIKLRFGDLHRQASRCELYKWRETTAGVLAEIIILDQFSRNIYRNQAFAFASDALALSLAQTAVAAKVDQKLNITQRPFLYLPYMHSESQLIHTDAVVLFNQEGIQEYLDFEIKHKSIIDRFGRYPHRNSVLGRVSTSEEIEFLKKPDSSF